MRSFKKKLSLFLVGIILGISTMFVYAAYTSGPYGYYGPQMGYSYKNQNTVVDNGEDWGITADIIVRTQDASAAPVGYMGALARLYNEDDDLVRSTSWDYSDEATHIWSAATTEFESDGYYYSYGLSKAYNGAGYFTYDSYPSPLLAQQ